MVSWVESLLTGSPWEVAVTVAISVSLPRAFAGIETVILNTPLAPGFREIVEGEHDGLPEQAFYMVGNIDDAIEKAKKL